MSLITRIHQKLKKESLIKEMFATVGKRPGRTACLFLLRFQHPYRPQFYANFNLTIVDDYTVTIGDNVLIAPNVTLSVTGHPVHHELRKNGEMYSFPITIGNNVWIGSHVVINPASPSGIILLLARVVSSQKTFHQTSWRLAFLVGLFAK